MSVCSVNSSQPTVDHDANNVDHDANSTIELAAPKCLGKTLALRMETAPMDGKAHKAAVLALKKKPAGKRDKVAVRRICDEVAVLEVIKKPVGKRKRVASTVREMERAFLGWFFFFFLLRELSA